MNLLTKLFVDAADDEFRLAQDLVAIAIADGSISQKEYETIARICQEKGIPADVLEAYMQGQTPSDALENSLNAHLAMSQAERADYLSKLIQVMTIDGDSSQIEIFLLEVIAGKMGASRMELLTVMLTTTSRRLLPGDLGSRALRSFLKNIIDPKTKTLSENEANMRAVVNMMADYIHHTNPEASQEEFEQEMASAASLLMENDVLNKEFSTMGLNFKRTLQLECRQTVRRHLLAATLKN